MTQNQIAYKNARELERHNKASEAEMTRHQQMSEALQRWSNALTNYQIAVNNAHYQRMDAETERANRAREYQNLIGLGETQRSNAANEYIRTIGNQIEAAKASETSRHQKAVETETQRYNDALIEKAAAETGYTTEQTKQTAYTTIYLLPEQVKSTQASSYKASAEADTQTSVQFRNVMEGFSSGINAISNLGRTVNNFISPVSGTSNAVRDSFNQLLNSL